MSEKGRVRSSPVRSKRGDLKVRTLPTTMIQVLAPFAPLFSKRISREGDEMLRRLLVGSAHYILGPFAEDSDLRRHGLKIAGHTAAKNARKRAVVAVARKLSVLLHHLWISGEVYEPLYKARRQPKDRAA